MRKIQVSLRAVRLISVLAFGLVFVIALAAAPKGNQQRGSQQEIYRAYEGSPRPASEVVTLKLLGTRAMTVEGIPFFNAPSARQREEYAVSHFGEIALLPGRHNALSSKLNILVPARMNEHYIVQGLHPTDGARELRGTADYFNFHRFESDVYLDFSPLKPAPR